MTLGSHIAAPVRVAALLVAILLASLVPGRSTAAKAPPLKISLLGQAHVALAGSPWAYYVRAWAPDGTPWQGAIDVQVVTLAGKRLDRIGLFGFNGSWLRAYIWRRADKAQTLVLKIDFLAGSRRIATASYRVAVG